MSTKTLEIEEKSIDEAIETACREFGVSREKLNIEIISEGSSGFLGVMSKKAKIKASLVSFDMSFDLNDNHPSPSEPRLKIETKPLPEQSEILKASTATTPLTPAPAPVSAQSAVPEQSREVMDSACVPRAKELLEGILQRMSFECTVTGQETPEKIILNIEGDGSGLLIGKRGQNLDAIQYILNKAINKSDNERKMIMVDSEAYRKRREESLLNLAERIREKVKKTSKPMSLSHMNAHDRRIIHLALQEDDGLTTKSRGEGEYRKIVILPARRGNAGNPPRERKQKAGNRD